MLQQLAHQERKRFWLVCLLVVLALGGWLFFSPHGLVRYGKLKRQLEAVRAENEALAAHNKALAAEIAKLENDPAYLEWLARKEYGLVRKNEMIFDFPRRGKKH